MTLILKDLSYQYKNSSRPVLENMSFVISQQQHTLITGDSGCGKSTLLHMMAGLLKPVNGQVMYDSVDLYGLNARVRDVWRAKHIGIILQKFHLLSSLTVEQNLLVAQQASDQPLDRQRLLDDLAQLNIEHVAHRYPHELSQGQQQRASIARAIAHRPRWIFADEPTASLDDKNAHTAIELLHSMCDAISATLVVVSHDHRIKTHFTQQIAFSASGLPS